jgi:asparagine synthase (glutamine-hydrolysing)
MCGIAGILDAEGSVADLGATAGRMAALLSHRGPDDSGTWVGEGMRAALCHRRLAIRGLGPCGHQPMASSSGRWVVAYNGEIYNTEELRGALPRDAVVRLRGSSDTELLVECLDHLGIERTLALAAGMFAFAAAEPAARRLVLARDRLGIKPLAFAQVGSALFFGSDTRVFRAVPGFAPAVDPLVLNGYLRRGWVLGDRSILSGVRRLPPGTWLEFVDGRPCPSGPRAFWSVAAAWERARAAPLDGSDADLAEAVEALLVPVVRDHLASDVPLGSFLSGGIDSSLVTAIAAEASGAPVRTFTIGFDRGDFDESKHAEAVAHHLGTEHHTMMVGDGEALAAIPQLAEAFDEPFGDSSALPTLLLSRLTRKHVTVALAGDGGDELFAGYSRHLWIPRIQSRVGSIPAWGRHAMAAAIDAGSGSAATVALALPARMRPRQLADKARKAAALLRTRDAASLHRSTLECWPPTTELVHCTTPAGDGSRGARGRWSVRDVMLEDLVSYLPDDILVKSDRASMWPSLEARVPLLDHRLLELSMRLPERALARNGRGKWLLRRLLAKRVPEPLFDRPKSGFSVPIAAWLRGPLRSWAEERLDARELSHAGLLPAPFVAEWRLLLAGRSAAAPRIWNAIAYIEWRRRALDVG